MSYTGIHSHTKASKYGGWMANGAARLISDIANPMLVPTASLFAMGYLLMLSFDEMVWISGLAFFFFTLLPLLSALYLLQSGGIRSLDVPIRENRNKLYLLSLVSITSGSILLLLLGIVENPMLTESVFVFLANPLVGYLINRRYKISIHTAALATAGTLFLIFYLQMPELYGSFGLLSLVLFAGVIPAVSWSRFHLKIHSLLELLTGMAAGIICTLLGVGLLQMIW